MDVNDYLSGREEMRRRELVWGVVREPPAPRYGHQSVVTRATVILDLHVRERALGQVCVSPADVVLDEEKALIVQPDVFFVSNERRHIVRDQVWGAPDLVVEVAARATGRYDATTKLDWYRSYGVRECWLLDPKAREVRVVTFPETGTDPAGPVLPGRPPGRETARGFTGEERVRSWVLPDFATTAAEFFE